MTLRGQRFHIDLPSDEHGQAESEPVDDSHGAPALVGDIIEKTARNASEPTAPSLKAGSSGFPAHKKRRQLSRFQQQRTPVSQVDVFPPANAAWGRSIEANEARSIDRENRRIIAAMSDQDIENEQQEFLRNLDPSLVDKLMKDSSKGNSDLSGPPRPASESSEAYRNGSSELPMSYARRQPPASVGNPREVSKSNDNRTIGQEARDRDLETCKADDEISESKGPSNVPGTPGIHFPQGPTHGGVIYLPRAHPPALDPSSPSFLADLHAKYFPSLPAEPDKLAWMSSTPASDSPYLSNAKSLPVSAIRFSFDGTIVAPGTAQLIPVTKGLHHHGQAPESAGYTILELAYLARSAFPTQRCIAYQTLGRILYRLGKGGFDGISEGLWKCIEDGRVLESLQEEAQKTVGHVSAKAYATEALWLWSRGGRSLRQAK